MKQGSDQFWSFVAKGYREAYGLGSDQESTKVCCKHFQMTFETTESH